VIEKDHVEKWLSRGAVPSEQVAALLRNAGMTLGRPSAPKKKPAAAKAAKTAEPRKRAAPRKVSARKTMRKAARKSGKPAAAKPAKAKK